MKQIVVCTLICVVFGLPLSRIAAQVHHPLYEALALRKYFVQPTPGNAVFLAEGKTILQDSFPEETGMGVRNSLRPEVLEMFAPYCGGYDNVNQETINNVFVDNPFMVIEYTSNFDLKAGKMIGIERSTTLPSPSNPVSSIADGIARFLVKRTKEELSLAFFADFKKAVEADQHGFFQYFFSNTQQMLLVIDTEVYQFQIYLEALREAFISDMRFLPGNLSYYLKNTEGADLKPMELAITVDFFDIVQMNLDGSPTVEMIRRLGNDTLSEIQLNVDSVPGLRNLSAGLHLVNQISESLFNPYFGRWYTGAEIRQALADPVTFRLYMGLLWHQARSVDAKFKNNATLEQLIAKAAVAPSLMSDWQQVLTGFGENASEMEQSNQRRRLKESSLSENFSRCLQLFTQVLKTANTLNTLLNPDAGDAIEQRYLQLIQQIGSLHLNATQKHYSAAVGNTTAILGILVGDEFKGKKDLLKYGMFIAAVAEAENASEVENALELFALPPGSSKAKKVDNTFSIAINAYTGANLSSEQLRTRQNPEIAKKSTSLAVAAPLGFSVNWGKNWGTAKKPKSGSIGFFFPVIDVGAIYAYRFQDDGVDNLPPLEWKNIIAPGVYLVVDPPLGKWPMAFGVGGQLGPLLRKVEENGTFKNKDVGGYRLGVFATFDIPINYLKLKVND